MPSLRFGFDLRLAGGVNSPPCSRLVVVSVRGHNSIDFPRPNNLGPFGVRPAQVAAEFAAWKKVVAFTSEFEKKKGVNMRGGPI